MSPVPSIATEVDGKLISVFDDVISKRELNVLYSIFQRSPFKKQEVATAETEQFKHWVTEIPQDQIQTFEIYRQSLAIVKSVCQREYKLFRSYCNFASYGDMLFTHTDCPSDIPGMTALWYICPEWDVEWGGETLFFDKHKDCRFACSPRPGRLAVFDGSLLHAGRPPNRICYEPRYTVAFKLVPPEFNVVQ